MLKSSLNIFSLYPPSQKTVFSQDTVTEIQIQLHAFIMNMSGIFDNFMWAFVHKKRLNGKLDKFDVGVLQKKSTKHLDEELQSYINEEIKDWLSLYLKDCRDSLAHRIPLYLIPAVLTQEDAIEFQGIEKKVNDIMLLRPPSIEELNLFNKLLDDKQTIGKPFPVFRYEKSEGQSSVDIFLHSQIVNDLKTLAGFSELFYKHWSNC